MVARKKDDPTVLTRSGHRHMGMVEAPSSRTCPHGCKNGSIVYPTDGQTFESISGIVRN